jgi:glutamate formiminotransferase / 5-formyltetrahydrofolate cyclo-ligase
VLDCAVNVSEGRRPEVIGEIVRAAGDCLLDAHSDPDHNRSVLTLAGHQVEEAVREVAVRTVGLVDLTAHRGVHPRLGALDVVPFSPLPWTGANMSDALGARNRFAAWAGGKLGVPMFLYGPERSLPEVRRLAFKALAPVAGPSRPHPTAGATAAGARPLLVAYNLWIDDDLAAARRISSSLRSAQVRALALPVAGGVQVSCNLVDPARVGPADIYDRVRASAHVDRAELVGLVPAEVLSRIPERRWGELDLDPSRTIEHRLAGRAGRRATTTPTPPPGRPPD